MCLFKKFTSIVMALLVLVYFCPSIHAEGNLHIGALEIHPFAVVEQKCNDNIFLEANEAEDEDWITTTTLGFDLKTPLIAQREEDFILEAQYAADIIEFWDYSSQDRIDHTISVKTDFKFANDFSLKLKEDFKKTATPPTSETTSLERRFRNTAEVVCGYKRERIGLDLGYTNIRDEYNNLNSLDKDEDIITTTGFYELFSKTSIFGEYNYGKIVYDDNTTNSDSKYHQFRIGVKGEIAPKLSGVAKAGFKTTDYKDTTKNDFEGFTLFGDLTYSFQERSTLNLYGEKNIEESTYSTVNYYETNKMGIGLDHQLLEKLFLVAAGSYQFNKYPGETTESSVTLKRKDSIWDGKVGFRYEIKDWVHLEADYEHKHRDSKFSNFDYKNNIFSIKATFVF